MKSKTILSLILSASMVVPLLPVWAEGEPLEQPEGEIKMQEDYVPIDEQTTQLLQELLLQQDGQSTAGAENQAATASLEMGTEEAKEPVVASAGEALVPTEGYWHESMEQYQQFDYSDPNWITDEDFFGKWNGSSWEVQPRIDYSYGDLLMEAETAVKAGDYETAKEYVFQYYKDKFQKQPRSYTGSADRRIELSAQIQFDNMFFNQATGFNVLDKFSVPNTDAEVSANIIEEVQSAATAANKTKCFVLLALKKDGYQVDFHSADAADHQPYVVVNVNGTNRTFYPVQDVMVSAGSNASRNYGGQETISVQEAAINEAQPVNSDTKRIYMNFDFTGLNEGDEITEARLYLYGHNTKPEGDKDVVIFSNTNATWKENTVTFGNLEHLIFSYDGESGPKWEQPANAGYRYEEELNRFENYASAMRQRYIYTEDEVYAYHGLRLWLDLYRKKGSDPGWRVNLDLGVRGQNLPVTLAYYMDSEFMTKEVFTPLLKFAWAMGDALINRWNDKSKDSNWGAYETAGLSNLAINFNEFYDSTKPMDDGWESTPSQGGRGGWIEVAAHRYELLAGTVLNSDGSCTEVSLEYSSETIGNMMQQVTFAEQAGWYDFELPENLKPLLTQLAKYLVNASGPNFTDFQQGNASPYTHSYLSSIKRVEAEVDDPLLKWAVSEGKEGTPPDYTSILYPVGVKAILRSGWEDDDVYIQTNADGGVVSHGHFDDMGLNMFAYGQYLLVDPKYINYDNNNPYRAWQNSARAHNMVEINDTSPKANSWNFSEQVTGPSGETISLPSEAGVPGSIVESELNDGYDYVYLNTPNYLDTKIGGKVVVDVDYDRSILFIRPGYAIVTDYLKPQDGSVNKYSQAWHFLPEANISMDEETGTVRTNFEDSANIQVIPVQQSDDMQASILDGWYSHSTGNVEPMKYAAYVKNKSGNTAFNTVLLPMNVGKNPKGVTENILLDVPEHVASAFHLFIDEPEQNASTVGTYYTLLDKTQQAQRDFDQFSTDGTLSYVEQENEVYTRVILREGTNLVNNDSGVQLVRSKNAIEDLSVRYNVDNMEIDTSKELNLEELQLYSGNRTIKEVKLNGESVTFHQDGETGDIYFASDMPFDGNENTGGSPVATPTPKPPTGGAVHGGGGGGGGGSAVVSTPTPSGTPTPTPTPGGTVTPTPTPTVKPSDEYAQQLEGHWAQQEISAMLDEGIIQGVGPNDLGLQNETTRAEYVTMLIRAIGLEVQSYNGEFADVAANDWYADYMATAKNAGILEGDGINADPNGLITREEMAKILVAVYEKEHGEIAIDSQVVSQFQDISSGSSWADISTQKAISAGLMNGISNTAFAPLEYALREQAIVVVYRMKEK